MLAPLAPHVAEELWHRLGHDESLTYEPFPVADPALLVDDTVEYPVQVNGKVRSAHRRAPPTPTPTTVEAAALADAKVVAALAGGDAEEGHRRPRPDGQRRALAPRQEHGSPASEASLGAIWARRILKPRSCAAPRSADATSSIGTISIWARTFVATENLRAQMCPRLAPLRRWTNGGP